MGPWSEARSREMAALRSGALVLTPNARAARAIRAEYDEGERAKGAALWEPAAVRSWGAWVESLWRELLLGGRTQLLLLNAHQEHALWRRVLAEDGAAVEAAARERLAAMAASAWRGLCAHRGRDRLLTARAAARMRRTADTDAFARWAAAFERRCTADGLLSEAVLEEALADAFADGALPARARVVLTGFDELSPARERLLGAYARAGGPVDRPARASLAENAAVYRAIDADEELRACASWCRTQLARGRRVAVIVPDPAAERGALGRALRGGTGDVFEFANGGPPAQQPMIAAALDTLRLAAGALPVERVSALLLSRYFAASVAPVSEADGDDTDVAGLGPADGDELQARAEFDAFELLERGRLRAQITLDALREEVDESPRRDRLPLLREGLRRLARRLARLGARPGAAQRSHGDWAEVMRKLLRAAGWGPRAQDETGAERHLRRLWDGVLDALATLDFDGGRISFARALEAVTQIAGREVYAPEPSGAPIAMLSPSEAEGSVFDAMWCLRAGESSWMVQPQSHALLPWELQRELGMAGADRERDRERAERVMWRLRQSAAEVVFSYAEELAGGKQRALAAVRAMRLPVLDAVAIVGDADGRTPVELEAVPDAARVRSLPDRVRSGGAQILEAQAACAFRAFAEHRLWSTEPGESEPGLDRGRRGTLVHHALEHLWGEVQSQERLRAMSMAERRAAVERAADHAFARGRIEGAAAWEGAYLRIQRERLLRLLTTWLEVELARPAFTVAAQELVIDDARIGPLRLKLRIDRVDRVGDRRVLIDYKTGQSHVAGWNGKRPDAPQLPLYAVVAADDSTAEGETPLGAVAFASVHAGGGARLRGQAEREGLLPGKTGAMDAESFAAQIDRWREVLAALAEQFAAGDAAVRPKVYPGTCRHCAQRLLCRLDAAKLDEVDEDEGMAHQGEHG